MGRCRMLRKGSAATSNTYSNCTQPMMLQGELWSRWAKWKALRFPAQVPSTAVLRGHGLAARVVLRQRGCGCSRHYTDATTGSGSRRRQLSPVHCLATEVALPVACCLLLLLLFSAACCCSCHRCCSSELVWRQIPFFAIARQAPGLSSTAIGSPKVMT